MIAIDCKLHPPRPICNDKKWNFFYEFGKHTLHLANTHRIEKMGKSRRGSPVAREQTHLKGETRRRHLALPLIHVKTKV
jgi:hypothetical protein